MSEAKRLSRAHRHGHVGHNPTIPGMCAGCGGPFSCPTCRTELAEAIGDTHAGWHHEAADMNAVGADPNVLLWACRARELARELGRFAACLRDLVEDTREVMPALIYGTAMHDSYRRARGLLMMDEGPDSGIRESTNGG